MTYTYRDCNLSKRGATVLPCCIIDNFKFIKFDWFDFFVLNDHMFSSA